MNILISGASGLIGTALTGRFTAAGLKVFPLVRDNPGAPFNWQPDQGRIHLDETTELDAVINLSGPGVADKRWSVNRKAELLESRINGTRLLSQELAQRAQKPRVFVSASAIGFYGLRSEPPVDEFSECGSGFLADLARRWERATEAAETAGIRTIHARFGIVLSPEGGALARMLTPFRLGLGGIVGSGRQAMSWIAIQDLIRAIEFLINSEKLSGPVNLVAPEPVDNREFTRLLGKVLGRPTIIPMPAFLARLLFGEMAEEILLNGPTVLPSRLLDAGFQFSRPELEQALRSVLQ